MQNMNGMSFIGAAAVAYKHTHTRTGMHSEHKVINAATLMAV